MRWWVSFVLFVVACGDQASGPDPDGGSVDAGLDASVDAPPTLDAPMCIDGDGDQRGANCASGPDCDDADAARYQLLQGFVDADLDGVSIGDALQVCSGATLPAGYLAAANGVDCADDDDALYQLLGGYADSDLDEHSTGALLQVCAGATLPAGYLAVANGDDCAPDDNARYQLLDGYADSDLDGHTAGGLTQQCAGSALPTGYLAAANGSDCAPSDGTRYRLLDGYVDGDLDGYTTGGLGAVCSGSALPTGYLAAPNGDDCDDTSPVRFTAITAYPDQDFDLATHPTSVVLCGQGVVPPGYEATPSASPDCGDATALVGPAVPEIPDDGVDNDCVGGDVTHGQVAGVKYYVDATGCAQSPTGTAASPFCTIDAALVAIDATPGNKGTIFVAEGTYGFVNINQAIEVALFGGYANVAGTWSRDLANNTTTVQSSVTTNFISFVVHSNSIRVVLDGFRLVSANNPTFTNEALRLDSSAWVSRSTIVASPSMTRTIGVIVSELSTLVDNSISGFDRSAVYAVSNTGVQLFENEIQAAGGSSFAMIADLQHSPARVIGNHIVVGAGVNDTGLYTQNSVSLVANNTFELSGGTGGKTTIRNGGAMVIVGNRLTGTGGTGCVSIMGDPSYASSTIAVGNVIDATSTSGSCGGVAIHKGTSFVAHNVVLATGTTSEAVRYGTSAGPAQLVNNVLGGTTGLVIGAANTLDAHGNTFLPTVTTLVQGASVSSASAFDACQWTGCVSASGTRVADPGFVSAAAGDYHLQTASVCIDGGVAPMEVGLTPPAAIYYALGGSRPLGPGWDVGVYEQ
ncbi:MAG: right-handed parallel beta-helix repeat-containing protein [Kofleriaceae bacterium]|nr:right-handed parallel beta-helix repeat-containing protein [Kofleriaceae bacterium]